MSTNDVTIYGVKNDKKIHYIGKTSRNRGRKITKSDATQQYVNQRIRNVFLENPTTEVVSLKEVPETEWYDEKLHEVVAKHKDNHPLLNAQWMLEGKRGYWEGKKRDKHTLHRLSESKFKKVIQYDENGNFVKIWDSAKEIANTIFNDYVVVRGSASSTIYRLLDNSNLKNKFDKNSYWFRYEELLKKYGGIPAKLNFSEINELRIAHRKAKYVKPKFSRVYTVFKCDPYFNLITRYKDAEDAARKNRLTPHSIRRLCKSGRIYKTGRIFEKKYMFVYGNKVLKPITLKVNNS